MPPHDLATPKADQPCCLHIFLFLFHQRSGAHRSCKRHPFRQADGGDQNEDCHLVAKVRRDNAAQHAEDEHRDQDRGERQLDIGDPHDQIVEPTADIPRDKAERDADPHRQKHRHHPDKQRNAKPVDDRRQQVPSLIIGSHHKTLSGEHVGCQRRGEAVHQVQRGRIKRVGRRNQRREDRDDEQEQHHCSCQHGDRRAGEIEHEITCKDALNDGRRRCVGAVHDHSPRRLRSRIRGSIAR